MISDYIPFVNQHDINIIKQQFTCLLRTIGKYVEQLSFARRAPQASHQWRGQLAHILNIIIKIFSPLSPSSSRTMLLYRNTNLYTKCFRGGEKCTHTRTRAYEHPTHTHTHTHTLIVREKEIGPNMFIYMYKVSQRRRWGPGHRGSRCAFEGHDCSAKQALRMVTNGTSSVASIEKPRIIVACSKLSMISSGRLDKLATNTRFQGFGSHHF